MSEKTNNLSSAVDELSAAATSKIACDAAFAAAEQKVTAATADVQAEVNQITTSAKP